MTSGLLRAVPVTAAPVGVGGPEWLPGATALFANGSRT